MEFEIKPCSEEDVKWIEDDPQGHTMYCMEKLL